MTKPPAHSPQASRPWWQTAVIYQIYVRSFCDSNADGVGDLPGVIAKLDYLKDLGVGGIWLSPVTASANADWGYDVTDYFNVDPSLGTMTDFDQLIAEAHRRNIKVLTDFVPNHTSTKHPWFQDALTGRDAKYRDYYIWADPKPGASAPSNWHASFGGSAWTYHEPTNQYYLHNFLEQQADLNWRSQKVRDEFGGIMQFWLDKGVDGFRIDVFNMLIKDSQLRNNPRTQPQDGLEIQLLGQRPLYNTSRPELHGVLRRWRKLADAMDPPRLLLGESTLVYDLQQLSEFYGHHDELELVFNLKYIHSPFEAAALREVVEETEAAIAAPDFPVWTNSNHDQSRFTTRWAKGDERKIRLGLLCLLTLRGTPVIYYGDEVGMPDTSVARWRLKDPVGKRFWPAYSGRDRARTPMPWSAQEGAGFTDANVKPWLPFGSLERNVADQRLQADSIWCFTRDLIKLRQDMSDLAAGSYGSIPSPADVWAWRRGKGCVVMVNFSDDPTQISVGNGTIMICSDRSRDDTKVRGEVRLEAWQGVVVKLDDPG